MNKKDIIDIILIIAISVAGGAIAGLASGITMCVLK